MHKVLKMETLEVKDFRAKAEMEARVRRLQATHAERQAERERQDRQAPTDRAQTCVVTTRA
jgi:hypothetical protein